MGPAQPSSGPSALRKADDNEGASFVHAVMPLAPLTLQVSPRIARRVHLLILAPIAFAGALAVALFAMLPPGQHVPVPFSDAVLTTGRTLTLTLAGALGALVAVAALALRANARRLTASPFLVATPEAIELPMHRLRVPWREVAAIVPRTWPMHDPRVHLILRPTFTRERVAEQFVAAGRSPRKARFAALAAPLLTDRSGATYVPLVPRFVDMSPAELAKLLEQYQVATRSAPAA